MKYKVTYKGFCYVEAVDFGDALEKADIGDCAYEEKEFCEVEEVDEFIVEM